MRARAAVLRELGAPLAFEEIDIAPPRADEVLVRVRGVGICHTDLSALDGTMPRPLPTVLGHEGSGIVEAVGEGVTTLVPGDQVVLSFAHCGTCRWCEDGVPAYCDTFVRRNYAGTRLDGSVTLADAGGAPVHGSWFAQSSFAEFALAEARNAVKVESALAIELLGPFGCAFMTGAGTVMNVLRPAPGDAIAIFGLGPVGLAAVMAAAAAGCDPIIGVDVRPERLELAESVGVTHPLDASRTERLDKAIRAIAPGGLACSLDAVGTTAVVQAALRTLRSPGLCATVAFRGNRNDITIDQAHLLFGRGLLGVAMGGGDPHTSIPQLLDMQARGEFPVERLITTFPFEQIEKALDAARSGAVVKPVLVLP